MPPEKEVTNIPLLARLVGFTLHTATVCEAHQRDKLERFCYIDSADRSRARFRWVKAPTSDELTQLTQLTHTIAQRVARYLERQGLLQELVNGINWNVCVAISPDRRHPLNAWC